MLDLCFFSPSCPGLIDREANLSNLSFKIWQDREPLLDEESDEEHAPTFPVLSKKVKL